VAGQSIGTVFVELDLDASRYTKSQQRLYKDATQVSLGIEDNFRKLGIKSSAEFDLMRAKITNSYDMIKNSSKATANDIIRAEQAKNAQLKALNDQQFGHQTTMLESLKKNWLAATAAITAAYLTVRKAWNLAEQAAQYEQSAQAFKTMAQSMGADAEKTFTRVRDLSGGLIDNKSLQESMNKAVSLGIPIEKLGDLMLIARAKARDMGITTTQAFNDIATGIGRGSPLILDNLGLTLKVGTANEQMADSLGKTVQQLTDKEKKQAILNATLDAGKEALSRHNLEVLTGAEKMDSFEAATTNLGLEFGRLVKGPLSDVVGGFAAVVRAINDGIEAHREWKEEQGTLESQYEREIELLDKKIAIHSKFPWRKTIVEEMALQKEQLVLELENLKTLEKRKITAEAEAFAEKQRAEEAKQRREEELKATQFTVAELKAIEDQNHKEAILHANQLRALKEISVADNLKISQMEAKRLKEQKDEEKKYAADKANAYKTMYKDMGKDAEDYYDFELDALKKQRDNYYTLTKDRNVVDAWYLSKKKQLDREMILSSNDFFAGIRIGFERAKEDQLTWAQAGEGIFKQFATSGKSALSDGLFDAIKGDMKSFEDYWDSFFDQMLRKLTDTVAEMAIQWGIDMVGSGLGWWDSGLWKAEKDHLAVIHKGEMVVPADIASIVRGGDGSSAVSGVSRMSPSGGHEWSDASDKAVLGAVAKGTLRSYGLQLAQGMSLAAQNMIGWDRFVEGALNPELITGSLLAGGIPAGVKEDIGYQGKWAGYGQTIGSLLMGMASKLTGIPGAAAAGLGGVAGMAIGDAIGDALNARGLEGLRDTLEDALGYKGGRQAFNDFVNGMGAAGWESGGMYGWGGYGDLGIGDPSMYGGDSSMGASPSRGPGYDDYGIGYGDSAVNYGDNWGGGYGGSGRSGGGVRDAGERGGPAHTGGDYGGGATSGFGMRYGGLAVGPESGYSATLHGTELVVSQKASVPAKVEGGGGLVIKKLCLYIGNKEFTGEMKVVADGVVVARNERGVNPTARIYQ